MANREWHRMSDRYKKTRQAVKDAKKKDKIQELAANGDKVAWSLDESAAEEAFRELDVAELRWPEDDVRDSSQDFARIKPLKNKGPSHQLAISKCGHAYPVTLVAAASSSRSSSVKNSCEVCTHNQYSKPCKKDRTKENPSESYNLFSRLSDEIVLGVFKFLPRQSLATCARVCKRWQILVSKENRIKNVLYTSLGSVRKEKNCQSYDESLWYSVDMTKSTLQGGLLGRVLLRGTRVMRLASARVRAPVFDDSLGVFPDVVPLSPIKSSSEWLLRLRYLDATLCIFEDTCLLCLLLHSRRLQCLSLDSCTLSLSILRAIGDCHELEILNVAMCTGITLQGIKALVNGCKRLTQLNLAWTNLIKDSILQIVQNLPNLMHLNLSGSRETITDDGVVHLIESCSQLTHLDLSDCIMLTGRSLMAIVQQDSVQHLALSRCYNIPPQAFSWCAQMSSLTKLDVYGLLNTDGIELLKRQLPDISINNCLFSTIARPVDSKYRGTIWGVRCKR